MYGKSALDCTNTWEANTDLYRDGGSHNHQSVPTKATVERAGSRQTPSIEPPLPTPPPLLSGPQRRAVLDHTAAGDKTCALVNTQESHRGRLICNVSLDERH